MSFTSKRHFKKLIKDIMNIIKDIVKKDTQNLSEEQAFLIQGKLEKIIMAIYMVTEFFPKQEPLKYSLREKSVSFLSFIMSLKNDSSEHKNEILSLSSEINSLLKLSASLKLISEMNYSILISEYDKFLKMIKIFDEEKNTLSKTFFKVEMSESDTSKEEIYKGQYKGQKDNEKINVLYNVLEEKKSFERNKKDIVHKNKKEDKQPKKIKSDRKTLIVEIVKDKKEVTIKDIIDVIKNCSEKTIQRELVDLVNSGVLKKEGERRWSKYSLKG
jgi:hypothetical protein